MSKISTFPPAAAVPLDVQMHMQAKLHNVKTYRDDPGSRHVARLESNECRDAKSVCGVAEMQRYEKVVASCQVNFQEFKVKNEAVLKLFDGTLILCGISAPPARRLH